MMELNVNHMVFEVYVNGKIYATLDNYDKAYHLAMNKSHDTTYTVKLVSKQK